jgi:energy-coupling factor transport system substrate-specific component
MPFLKKYTSTELLYIAVFAALGLAIKPIVTPLIHLVSAPLLIPGGSLAGGFYMMWLVLPSVIISKRGTAFLTGLIQAIVVLSLGYFGNHGAISLLSYTLPGLTIELASLFFKDKKTLSYMITASISANLCGVLIVTILVMRLAILPFLISMFAAILSGIIGGILSFEIIKKLKKYHLETV